MQGGKFLMSEQTQRQALLLGVGLDNRDGHVRVTKGGDFVLLGGSERTHQHMQDTAQRFTEELARRGKRMAEISRDEFVEIVQDAHRRE